MAEPSTNSLRGDIAALVRERGQHAITHYQSFFQRMTRLYDLYRGNTAGRFQQFRNNVHIPFLLSIVQSDVARKVQTSFGGWPVVTFGSYQPDGVAIARKNETLISAQMKDAESFCKAVDFFVTADLYGTAIARVGWLHKERVERIRVPDSILGMVVEDRPVTWFDGPDWTVVDPIDFWPQPGRKRLQECDWVIHRYWVEYDTLYERALQGEFDVEACKRLKDTPVPEVPGDKLPRVGPHRSWDEYSAMAAEKFARPVELWEMWGLVPTDMAPGGVRFRCVTLANKREIVKNIGTPFWHGNLPFLSYCPMPDPHYFHGTGKLEICEKLQVTSNKLMNHQLDTLDLSVSPPFIADRNSGIDLSNLFLRPGRVIPADGAVDDTKIRPLQMDLGGINAAAATIPMLWTFMQQGTGIVEDTIMGGSGSSRQTAREYLGRQEAVLTRLMLEARLAEEGFIEPLANMFVALNKQYLPLPKKIPILGSSAVINPITGLPLPQEPTVLSPEDIAHNYKARALGATQMLGKAVKQQNLMSVLQILSSNPVGLQIVNWVAFFRQAFETFDLKNVDELLVTKIPAINQLVSAQGTGGPGGSVGQMGVSTLEQLDPSLLGAMGGGQPQAPIPGV